MNLFDVGKLANVNEGAKYLLGCVIKRTLPNGEVLSAKIVETESYHQDDPASHTFKGETPRTAAMFGPAGKAYVYFTYGMYWCFNVTAGKVGHGAGILIRAVEPLEGLETMKLNRNRDNLKQLTNGPAKLAQALAIDKNLYGHDLTKSPLQIFDSVDRNFEITETTRVGISQAVDTIARYYIKDNLFVSKK